jgi:predicted tellurium resistance membrane protein TerC
MGTNKQLLSKGIKYLGALPLLFIGPSLIYNAFMNQQNVWHYLILAIGIVACLAAMYYVHGIENYNEKFIQRLMEELIHIQKNF